MKQKECFCLFQNFQETAGVFMTRGNLWAVFNDFECWKRRKKYTEVFWEVRKRHKCASPCFCSLLRCYRVSGFSFLELAMRWRVVARVVRVVVRKHLLPCNGTTLQRWEVSQSLAPWSHCGTNKAINGLTVAYGEFVVYKKMPGRRGREGIKLTCS